MAVARQILERSTMMLLTSSKVTNASKLYAKNKRKEKNLKINTCTNEYIFVNKICLFVW